jgi:hypothetical protein
MHAGAPMLLVSYVCIIVSVLQFGITYDVRFSSRYADKDRILSRRITSFIANFSFDWRACTSLVGAQAKVSAAIVDGNVNWRDGAYAAPQHEA